MVPFVYSSKVCTALRDHVRSKGTTKKLMLARERMQAHTSWPKLGPLDEIEGLWALKVTLFSVIRSMLRPKRKIEKYSKWKPPDQIGMN